MVNHSFEAIYDKDSIYLFLGSFPSVKSREYNFYYMHPQNRFYPLLKEVFNDDFTTLDLVKKKKLLLKHKIALFDVIKSCEIVGSSDSSIKNITPNDIEYIVKNSNIKKIILNGKLAYNLFIKYFPSLTNISYYLPSTSPANAKCSLDKLKEILLDIINK
jgi:hypoxanthine-DNA glycosylase